ncbi:peroxidase family protein [Frankia gtarii]|uniref:peroxidase family protein n=1 Tax=Frankia gtarii TaxID=2950102 RepID=UPI0021C21450|nr:peroxidase family protein [Frankia gtarii]
MFSLPRPPLSRQLARTVGRLGLRPPVLPSAISRFLPNIVEPLGKVPVVRRWLSQLFINYYGYAAAPRPLALTLGSDYTTWRTLTDRTYSGRHLPPATRQQQAKWPAEADVVALFRRDREIKSTDTSVMFMFFAQWFTDSFLRTSRDDYRRNTSNHEIDLCQIYGLTEDKTSLLRSGSGGQLKHQYIDGKQFPVFLFERRQPGASLVVKSEFQGLHDEEFLIGTILDGVSEKHKDTVFAVGLEHGNSTIGQTMMNVVFFREHNRIAGVLEAEYPEWDDARLFDTTRNVMIVLTLKLVVEQYIKHIGPFDFPIEAVPFLADGELWNRSNWSAVEFNLLYRWHQLVPDVIGSGPDRLEPGEFRNNNPLVLDRGVEGLMALCSRERAGKIGLGNTPSFLVDGSRPGYPSIEERTVALMRKARLRSYNEYREAFGLRRLSGFDQLTSDPQLRRRIEKLYTHIDDLEWYVGIFAEDYPDYLMMGELLTTMVAHDAFTQALTNPLLARNIFNEATFSPAGLKIIGETHSLGQIVARNATPSDEVVVEFRC